MFTHKPSLGAVLRLTVFAGLLAITFGENTRAQGASYAWKSAGTERGVNLYTSDSADSSYDAVKGATILPVGTARLLEVLQTFARYPKWYADCAEIRVLKAARPAPRPELNPQERDSAPIILFIRQHASPFGDRWAILQTVNRPAKQGSSYFEFRSLERYPYAPAKSLTRMRVQGYWELQSLGPNRTRVTFVLDADPRVSVPGFLVNPALRDKVVQTLHSLLQEARSGDKPGV